MTLLLACTETWTIARPDVILKGSVEGGMLGWSVDDGGTFGGMDHALLVSSPQLTITPEQTFGLGFGSIFAVDDFSRDQVLEQPEPLSQIFGLGTLVAGGQDFDDCGYDDYLVTDPFYCPSGTDGLTCNDPDQGGWCFVSGESLDDVVYCVTTSPDGSPPEAVVGPNPPAWLGDPSGDGHPDFALAASGAVFLANLETNSWFVQREQDSYKGYGHGHQAGLGDLDGDGRDEFIFSAPLANDGGGEASIITAREGLFNNGQVNIIEDERRWTLQGDTANLNNSYGNTMAAGADITGDGKPDLVVGAPYHLDANGDMVGAIYIYEMPPPSDLQVLTTDDAWGVLTCSTEWPCDVGMDLCMQIPADLASGALLVVGRVTLTANSMGAMEGMVTILRFPESDYTGGVANIDDCNPQHVVGSELQHTFGSSVSCGSDLDGGGMADIVTGQPGDSQWGVTAGGSVSVYFGENLFP